MTWIEVVWPMMAAASLTLAWIHLMIWIMRRDQRVHLLFALAAAAVAGIALLELMEFRSATPAAFAAAIRWAHPLLAIFMISAIGIVRIQFQAGRLWLVWTIVGLRLAAVLANFLTGANLSFREVHALEYVEFWGSGPLAVGVGVANPWLALGQISNLLLVAYLADAIVSVWRRDGARQQRMAILLVAGSFAVAMLLGGTITAAVALGWLKLPLMMNPMFLPALLAMSYQLGSDVVRAGILGERLSHNEAELRASEARFRQVVEAAPAGMLMVASDGRIAMANVEVERLFGHAREDLLRMRFADLVPAIDVDAASSVPAPGARAAASRPAGLRRECAGRRRDGSEVPIELGFSPVDDSTGGVLLVTINDIGERLRREREAAQHQAQVTHLSRVATIGELTGSLAHEITQPLTSIMSNAQAAIGLYDGGRHASPDMRDCLAAILEGDRRAIEVIRRLRRMLKKQDIEFRDLNLNELVQDTLQLARNDLLNRGVRVVADLAAGLPALRGDRIQLQQVLLNLLLNACDAMQGAPGEPQILVRTRATGDDRVELRVCDSGPGIAADQLERIFDPFVTTRRDGLGLGLTISRTILALHGGRISAHNRAEGGASFEVVLPVAGAPEPVAT